MLQHDQIGYNRNEFIDKHSGFGGLVVSMLPSGTRVRGFEPGRSSGIFRVFE